MKQNIPFDGNSKTGRGQSRDILTKLRFPLLVLLLSIYSIRSEAKIDLVTLPSRDETKITIYNNEDITLVDEKRLMTFKKGLNEIQFSWAGTLIDPTSLDLEFLDNKDQFTIEHITYPARTDNVLIWTVNSKFEGVSPIRISYFLSGVTWQADYVLIADQTEKKAYLEGYVKVINNSGEDFEKTQVRLVIGTINLVEKIAELARRRGAPQAEEMKAKGMVMKREIRALDELAAAPTAAPPKIEKETVSEYYLYTVEGRDDIPTGWSKRLLSISKADIPIQVFYQFDQQKFSEQVMKFYRFFNKKESNLGDEPLPDGLWNVFLVKSGKEIYPADFEQTTGDKNTSGATGLSFINAVSLKYVPKGEKVELNLGLDGLIVVEPKVMKFVRKDFDFSTHGDVVGFDTVEDWTLEVRNSKSLEVPVEVMRYFSGDFEFTSKDDYSKENANSVKYIISTPPRDKKSVSYTVLTHTGSRAKK